MNKKILTIISVSILTAVLCISLYHIIRYYSDYNQTNQTSEEMRDLYYEDEKKSKQPAESTDQKAEPTDQKIPDEQKVENPSNQTFITAETENSDNQLDPDSINEEIRAYEMKKTVPTVTPFPYHIPNDRFLKIKQTNQDIVAWLKIDDLTDEAIVQKDNTYYLDHDTKKHSNVNGALFLDESCNLADNPKALVVYGHNMKTGIRFGFMHSYFTPLFWHQHPIVTFDTEYADGQYVVFAAGDFPSEVIASALMHASQEDDRTGLFREIDEANIYQRKLDLNNEDDLLFLVTCTGEKDKRKALVCRKLRETESIKEATALIQKTQKK